MMFLRFSLSNIIRKMSGFIVSLSWGAFLYGLYELLKMTPHTEEYDCALFIVVCAGILGPGVTLLILVSACWRARQRSHQRSPAEEPLLPPDPSPVCTTV